MARFEFRILTDDRDVSDEEMIDQGYAAIEAAIAINILHFKRHPEDICALACGKVKYDSKNQDVLSMISEISTVPVLIRTGVGLCIDIVAFDVSVKRFENYIAWPHIISRGSGIFHVLTHIQDVQGRAIEYDPSLELEQRGLVATFQPDSCNVCRM
jgi:hypothetical protein